MTIVAKATVGEINAAIGGTGSDLGVFRLRHDVLARQVAFVEPLTTVSAGHPVTPDQLGLGERRHHVEQVDLGRAVQRDDRVHIDDGLPATLHIEATTQGRQRAIAIDPRHRARGHMQRRVLERILAAGYAPKPWSESAQAAAREIALRYGARGYFDAAAARRGEALFAGKAKCATCHEPHNKFPAYTRMLRKPLTGSAKFTP